MECEGISFLDTCFESVLVLIWKAFLAIPKNSIDMVKDTISMS